MAISAKRQRTQWGTGKGRPLAGEHFDNLNPDLRIRLQQLIAASGGRVWLVSGYRSVERQRQLWANAVKKYGSEAAARKWVAPPGKSNHNHGEAIDLGGDLALAARLAPQFGLHRPMSWEPWHFERIDKGPSDPDALTTPPDDMPAVDPTDSKVAFLANLLGSPIPDPNNPDAQGVDPMNQLMQAVRTSQAPAASALAAGGEVSGSGIQALVQAARAAGFSGEALVQAVAIGMAESKGDPNARGVNKDEHRSIDRGLWQINDYWHKEVSDEEAYDPVANARHAFRISGGGKSWTPWTTFKTGAYKQYLDEARAAAGM